MKIKVIHDVCGRDILVRQILDNGGHCPWDGLAFNKDYTANLSDALDTMENAGNVLENTLEEVAGMRPSFRIDRPSLLAAIDEQLERLNRDRVPAALNQARSRGAR